MSEDKFDGRVQKVNFKRFVEGGAKNSFGLVPVQRKIDIFINGERAFGMSCLPFDLESLAVGFLLTEGFIVDKDELASIKVEKSDEAIKVLASIPDLKIENISGKLRFSTGCGRAIGVDDIQSILDCKKPYNLALQVKSGKILELMGEFLRSSEFHKEVGGVHSAALSFGEKLDYFADDISRHNAVDRVIGQAFMDGKDIASAVLLTTGRLTFDMVTKAARVRIPIVVSFLSATYQAIELAKKFHITLCARCRAKQMDVYTCDWRIVIP
ncbi:MAG: formate dehydrogenase accessory sulfurtransferase FdhD [Candidatus Aenigmatarchaeota archaeon]